MKDCSMCEAYQDERIAKNCPKHENILKRIYRKLQVLFDPAYVTTDRIL